MIEICPIFLSVPHVHRDLKPTHHFKKIIEDSKLTHFGHQSNIEAPVI